MQKRAAGFQLSGCLSPFPSRTWRESKWRRRQSKRDFLAGTIQSEEWGAQPPRLLFGAPRAELCTRRTTIRSGASRRNANDEGAVGSD
ncbi:MAG: hypothetical protein DME21_09315 [Verrucomicrobia bacterium]|nr:MAG: hypothetical protein DME21_09315 [Verrucomicrobiota bacterium]